MKIFFISLICLTSCNPFQNDIVPFPMKKIKDGALLSVYDVGVYRIETKKNITLQDLANYPKGKPSISYHKKTNWMLFDDYPEKHRLIEGLMQSNAENSKLINQLNSPKTMYFSGYYANLKNPNGSKDKFYSKIFFINPDTKMLYKLIYVF